MEFTVSRADIVRELNPSQGVVEKKPPFRFCRMCW